MQPAPASWTTDGASSTAGLTASACQLEADDGAVVAELAAGERTAVLQHDRREYQQQMGHVWLGFNRKQIETWTKAAGLTSPRWIDLPADPAAKGPGLFASTTRK